MAWNWGGGAPGGKVAEVKHEGQVAITSKRGNTIKKNAEPDNPAVHISRSGNDVVKKASELNIEEKSSENKNSGKSNGGAKANGSSGNNDNDDGGDEKEVDEDGGDGQDQEQSTGQRQKSETGLKRKAGEAVGDEASENGAEADEDNDEDEAEYELQDEDEEADNENEDPHTTNLQGKEVKKGGKVANKKQKRQPAQDTSGKTDGEADSVIPVVDDNDGDDDDDDDAEVDDGEGDDDMDIANEAKELEDEAEAVHIKTKGAEKKGGETVSARTRSKADA